MLKLEYNTKVICKKQLLAQKIGSNGLWRSFEAGHIYQASIDEVWILDRVKMCGVVVAHPSIENHYNTIDIKGWFFTTDKKCVTETFPYFNDYFEKFAELEEELFDI